MMQASKQHQTPTKTAASGKGGLQLKEISIIPITAAPAPLNNKKKPVIGKATSSNQSMADADAADSLRKKRCTDRYDSSESSDSGVVTMSADSTATSDASDPSDPGSPFSHTSTSTCTDDVLAAQKSTKISMPNVTSTQGGKTLKRQAQVTEKCDKKRVKKELCSKNNNVEIKLIPLSAPTTANGNTQTSVKKTNAANKSILSPITNNSLKKTAIITPPPPIVIPTVTSAQQPPNLTSITSTPIGVSAISKLTDYFKLKKDPAKLNEYCNMLLNLQSGAKQNSNSKMGKIEKNIAATTITPVTLQHQPKINPIKHVTSAKKMTNEKKTAKIAPIIPVARKNTTTQSSVASMQQPVKISPKKPVSIAPRIVDTTKTKILQPKPIQTVGKSGSQQQQQQPTVLLAAIRIPQQMQPSTQPPPLKIQSGLIQKTTTTTTTTTKLAPLLQFQQMIPNLIQFQSNYNDKTSMKSANVPTSSAPNLIVNNGQLTHQQQQQLFMNGAVIKLQPIPTSQHQSSTAVTSSTTMAQINSAAQKFAIQQQQQQAFTAQLTAQHMQQLFMTTPVLFNTSSIPTVLTSQLAGLQHAFNQQQAAVSMAPPSTIPALQPIQSSLLSSTAYASSSLTSTTNSLQLPSFSTLLQSHPGMAAAAQQLQNIQLQQSVPMMKPFTSLPPSLTITSGYVPNNHQMTAKVNVPPQATIAPTQKAPPPLAPASNHSMNLPKLISVTSSASQTSPKSSPPPLLINQKVSLPQGSPVVSKQINATAVKQENEHLKQNAICVVPPLPSPAKQPLIIDVESEAKITVTSETKDATKSAISIVVEEKSTIECAKSPILSQPKTIRFPPVNGKVTVWKKCVKISKTGVCNWEKCSKHFDSNADLLEHLHDYHINFQAENFNCQWRGCKVNGCKGSKGWLERHVMSHVGSKPFKCIVERCGLRFSTQTQLEKHVNSHFNSNDQICSNKRSSDPPAPKKVKKDQKKATKIRRQPWSARRFDFFDVGMMDVLQYRLEKVEKIMQGRDIEVTFKGRIIGKRRAVNGDDEYQVTWSPPKIVEDEWMKRPVDSHKPTFQLQKHVSVKRMSAAQRNAVQDYVNSVTKSNTRANGMKKSRKYSSTCSSRASIASTST